MALQTLEEEEGMSSIGGTTDENNANTIYAVGDALMVTPAVEEFTINEIRPNNSEGEQPGSAPSDKPIGIFDAAESSAKNESVVYLNGNADIVKTGELKP